MSVILNNSRITSVVMHLFSWVLIFAIPTLTYMENPEHAHFSKRVFIMLVGTFVTFYGNGLWAIDKLLFKKRYLWFIVFNFVLFLIVQELHDLLNYLWGPSDIERSERPERPEGHQHGPEMRESFGLHSLFVFNDILFYVLTTAASIGMRYFSMLSHLEMKQKKLENETLTSELSLLRYQIQPHFFFNSLNNIYSLIGNSPERAQRAVHSLSKMMRYILYDSSNQTISLGREIDFLTNYASLMRLRLRADAVVIIETNGLAGVGSDGRECDGGETKIPSLMLIPLLENAFKHGIGPAGEADIRCEMRTEGERLFFSVRNNVYSVCNEDSSHSGIGLANLRKRLDIIYGNTYFLNASLNEEQTVFTAEIGVPLRIS